MLKNRDSLKASKSRKYSDQVYLHETKWATSITLMTTPFLCLIPWVLPLLSTWQLINRNKEKLEVFPTLLPTLAERTSHAAQCYKSAELPVTWCRVMATLVESDELDQAEITRRTNKETVTVVIVEQKNAYEVNDIHVVATWCFSSLPSSDFQESFSRGDTSYPTRRQVCGELGYVGMSKKSFQHPTSQWSTQVVTPHPLKTAGWTSLKHCSAAVTTPLCCTRMMTCRILVYCISEGDRKLGVKCLCSWRCESCSKYPQKSGGASTKKQVWIFCWWFFQDHRWGSLWLPHFLRKKTKTALLGPFDGTGLRPVVFQATMCW